LVVQYSTLYLVDYFGRVKPEMSGMLLAAAKAHGYQLTMGIYAVAATALFFLTFALTRERVQPFHEKSTLKQDLRDLATNLPWLILFGMGTLTVCAVAIRSGAILYYFQYYVGNEKLAAAFMVTGTLMSLLGTVLIQYVTQFAGRKATYIGLATLGALFLVVSYWVRPEQVALIFVFQLLYCAVTGPTSAVLWAMFADSADYSEWRTGRRATGLVFSAAGMSNKLGWAIGGPVIMWLLAIFGYRAGVAQTPYALHGILLLFTVIPAVAFLLTGVGLLFYPLNEARMKKMQGELQARQAKGEAMESA
jgi:GPH family glycoside/pentoside/hexuronide:cation symporter